MRLCGDGGDLSLLGAAADFAVFAGAGSGMVAAAGFVVAAVAVVGFARA